MIEMTTTPTSHAQVAVDQEIAGKRLLILGAGLWQVEYIRHARRLGVETWVTDWSPTAVGRPESDHFEPIDVTDTDATLAFARRLGADGVLTAADVGVPTAALVATALSLPGYSEALALDATNKLRMRRRSEALGIPSPAFRAVSSVAEAEASQPAVIGPVIVKPVDGWSSRGVRFVASAPELGPAVQHALQASRIRQAMIEEFLVGTEGSVEALVQDGLVTILGVCDKTKSPLPYRYDLELRYPGAYDEATRGAIEELARRVAAGFGLGNGIIHLEFLVARDTNRIYLIEFAIRGCGSKVITHLMPRLTGVDVLRVLIRQAFGLRTPLHVAAPRRHHGALHFLLFPPGRVVGVRGIDDAKRVPGVIDVCVECAPGDVIHQVEDGRSRPGHLLVTAETGEAVQQAISRVRDVVRLDYEHATDVAPL
jgi:biotin carboxylase